jgi:peroxiredoxin Q/BCP
LDTGRAPVLVAHECLLDTLGLLSRRDRIIADQHTRTTPTARRNERGSTVVEEGKAAPDFALLSDSGETVTLSSLRGRPVVLYFYPKDDTPGCTAQACGIRDAWGEFQERGAVVLGVSPDSESSHVKFKEKYELPFTLLADTDHATAEDYGVWVEKNYAGKTYMGVERSTFVIDADGNVAKEMRRVKPDTHADYVLAALPS